MNKTLLLAAVTLSGCHMLIPSMARDDKAHEWENDAFKEISSYYAGVEKDTKGAASLEDLDHAYMRWADVYEKILAYQEDGEYNGVNIGTCQDKKRKDSNNCKAAAEMRESVAEKIGEVVHAGLAADPEPGAAFPAHAISLAQRSPDIAKAIDIDASMKTLVGQWQTFWSRKLKKAGSPSALVRKEGTGMCFFSSSPDGAVAFSFGTNTEDIYVHCVATDPIQSYERSQKDDVHVTMLTRTTALSGNTRIKDFPQGMPSACESTEMDFSTSLVKKALKSDDELEDQRGWRWVVLDVNYNVYNQTGYARNGDGSVREVVDQETIARGILILDMKDGGDEPEQVAAADDADESDEDEAPKPKKATKVAKSDKKKAKRKKRR